MGLSPTLSALGGVPTMKRSISLVGLDVHAAQTCAAILDSGTGELRRVKLRMPRSRSSSFLRVAWSGPGGL